MSLLHFIIFFLLSGLTITVVGAVQFKHDAGLTYLRYHFLFVGAILMTVGIVLLVVKCIWFRIPYPIIAYIDEDDEENGVAARDDQDDSNDRDSDKKRSPPGHISKAPSSEPKTRVKEAKLASPMTEMAVIASVTTTKATTTTTTSSITTTNDAAEEQSK